VAYAPPEYAVLVNGVSFAVALALLFRLAPPATLTNGATAGGRPEGWLSDLRTGLRHVFVDSEVTRVGITMSVVVNLVLGAYEPILVYRLRSDLAVGAEVVGMVFGVAGVASVVLAALLSWRAPARGFMKIMTCSVVLQGASVVVIALVPSVIVITLAQVVYVSAVLLYTVYWRALRQTYVPSHLLGRVAGACRSTAYTGAFLGSVISAILLGWSVAVSTTLFVAGGAVMAFGTLMTVHLRNRRKTGSPT
ncbi:hypothetical protein ACFQ08_17385, partial [Streptosporangium algeriense]